MGRVAPDDGLTPARRYYLKNIEERRASALRRYHANSDQIIAARREYQKAYRAAHKEKLRLQNMEWRQANAEELRVKSKAAQPAKYAKSRHRYLADSYARRAGRKIATPSWAREDLIAVVYKKAKELRMHVDHVVPLRSKLVSGLHVWWNLQLLHPEENNRKSNKWWPDGPEEGV